MSFGNQNVGSASSAQAVTLTNSGTTPLSISSIALTGTNAVDFAQTNTCPSGSSTLAAGSSCTINVTFTPGANGTRSASLTLTDNASDSPQSVALSGTGTTTTTYFSDGFESGNLNAWTLPSSDSTGSKTVQSTVVNSGSNALAHHQCQRTIRLRLHRFAIWPRSPDLHALLLPRREQCDRWHPISDRTQRNGGNVWEIDYNAGRHGLDFYFWNGSGGVYSVFSPNNVLSPDTWYSVQVQDFQTTTGHAQAWLNGTSLGSVDADLSTSTPYARLMFFDSAPGTIYLDDVSVSNT